MQSLDDRQAADARLSPLHSRLGFYVAGFVACGSLAFIALMVTTAWILSIGHDGAGMSVDFRVFWAAGKLAVAGEPLAVHDMTRLAEIHQTHTHQYMPWLYPPGFLTFVTPLGMMSFAMGFLIWTALSLGLIVLAVRPFVGSSRPFWVLMSLAPAYFPTFMLGQNSLFWMAGLLAALAALRSSRWVLAGVIFGLLTIKPQLGMVIPFALLAIGAWRTILVAGLTMIAVLVLPTLYYGLDYWPLLQLSLAEHAERLAFSVDLILLMVSPAFMFTLYGVENSLAWTLHWVVAAGALIALVLLWRSSRAGFDTKVAGLLCVMLLTAPYLWYYEGVLLAAVALFLLRGGVLDLRPLHLLILVPLWIGGGFQALNTFFDVVDQRWLGAAYISPLLLISLGLCLRQAFWPRHRLTEAP